MKLRNVFVDDKRSVKDIIEYDNNTLTVNPIDSISSVTLEFEFDTKNIELMLGDAWERGYGDLHWQRPDSQVVYPWYVMTISKSDFCGVGVNTGCNALCSWKTGDNTLSLTADLRSGSSPLRVTKKLEVCSIIEYRQKLNNPESGREVYYAAKTFCQKMCPNPVLPDQPVYGGNNWYYAYGKSSAKEILKDTEKISEWSRGLSNRPFMVIDACWQPYMLNEECCSGGPYPHGNYLFPNMKKLASQMSDMDVKPGLWYRPLKTAETMPRDYQIKNMILDPTVPQVYQILKEDAERLCSWGFKLLKHDFSSYDIFGLWGFEMPNGISYSTDFVFGDRTKTTAQAIKSLYQAIFEGVNGKALIIGCNTVGHLAAGLTHIQRTGDDTSGLEWERTRKMGVNTLAFRMCQNNTFFASDADCVGITDKIEWRRNSQWLKILSESGTPLFVSADPKCLNKQIENEVISAFEKASKPQNDLIPVDWLMSLTPTVWEKDSKEFSFNWD